MSPLVPIGAVVRAHGVRGWIRVRCFHAHSSALEEARELFLDGAPRRVEQVAAERGEWLVKLAAIDDRDAAEALRGSEVALPRAALPAAADDELYVADLVGCAVFDPAGAPLGTVRAVDNYGHQELLLVEPPGEPGGELLIPFVEPIVVSVDLEARRVVCDPPEGLLDLAVRGAGRGGSGGGATDGGGDAP